MLLLIPNFPGLFLRISSVLVKVELAQPRSREF